MSAGLKQKKRKNGSCRLYGLSGVPRKSREQTARRHLLEVIAQRSLMLDPHAPLNVGDAGASLVSVDGSSAAQ